MNKKLISIVIANYNYGRFLNEAIDSVLAQDEKSFEIIIIDGGSSDCSVDVIKRYEKHIAYWVSEKDEGQSDAFNKGFSHSNGVMGCWLNADDILLPGTLRKVLDIYKKDPGVEWIGGGMAFCDAEMNVVQMRIGTSVMSTWHKWFPMTVVGGPSSFFSIARLKEVGWFDVDLHFTMDGDLWRRLFKAGVVLRHVNKYFWGFRLHEESKTAANVTLRRMPSGHERECNFLRVRDNIPNFKIQLGGLILRIWKLLNGSMLLSYFDTMRNFRKPIGTAKCGRRLG